MRSITYTLIADGSSDQTLIPIINWLLDQIADLRYTAQFAQFKLPKDRASLLRRVEHALKVYECDILFIHRDAEGMDISARIDEIRQQIATLGMPYIPIVPIRMTEAWLLVDEQAIRSAASNPNGKTALKLPRIRELENLLDPKEVLFTALRDASELPPRRMANFRPAQSRHRVAELMDNFLPLRQLQAFTQFENALRHEISKL